MCIPRRARCLHMDGDRLSSSTYFWSTYERQPSEKELKEFVIILLYTRNGSDIKRISICQIWHHFSQTSLSS